MMDMLTAAELAEIAALEAEMEVHEARIKTLKRWVRDVKRSRYIERDEVILQLIEEENVAPKEIAVRYGISYTRVLKIRDKELRKKVAREALASAAGEAVRDD